MTNEPERNDGGYPQHVIVDPTRKVRFDATVNLGHILSLVAFLAAGAAAWSTLDKRVVVLEEARKVQIQRDDQQDAYIRERLEQLQRGVDSIGRSIERLADRMEGPRR